MCLKVVPMATLLDTSERTHSIRVPGVPTDIPYWASDDIYIQHLTYDKLNELNTSVTNLLSKILVLVWK